MKKITLTIAICSFAVLAFVLAIILKTDRPISVGYGNPQPTAGKKIKVNATVADTGLSRAEFDQIAKNAPKGISVEPPLRFNDGCDGIKDDAQKAICLNNQSMELALRDKNPAQCKKIEDHDYLNYCILSVAEEAKDTKMCPLIDAKEWENVCFMEIAHNAKDKTICGQIDYPYVAKKCRVQIDSEAAMAKNDLDACLALPNASDFRNLCIWTVAARKGANGCDLIQGQKDRDRCWSWHYLTEAFKKNNAAICDKAVINDFVAVCKEGVAQQSAHPDDPNIVYKMNSDSDRLDDLAELNIGTSPFIVDSDSDGVSDSDEMYVYHTDPTNPDTDGDGRIDGDELKQGKNIHVPD